MLRWIVTGAVLLGLLAGAWAESVRFRAWSLRRQAEAAYYAGDFDQALAGYERVLELLPGAPGSYTDPADSIAQLLEGPGGRDLPLERAETLGGKAARYYLHAIRVSPPNAWAYAGLGGLAGALKILRRQAVETDLASLSPDPIRNLRPEDRLHEAALAQAVRIEPRNYYYRDFLGDFYWKRGFEQRALEHFRIAARLQPVLDRHYYLGYLISVSPQVLEAVESGIRESLELPETEAPREDIHRFLAAVYTRLGRFAEARASLEAAAETTRYPHLIDIQIGRILAAEGKDEAALAAFRRSAELEPGYHEAWSQMGQALSRLGRVDEAIEAMEKARGLRPTDYQPTWNLARELERADRLAEAAQILETLVRLHPERRDPYQRLIAVYEKQERLSEALRVARLLAERNPDEEIYRQQVEQLERSFQERP